MVKDNDSELDGTSCDRDDVVDSVRPSRLGDNERLVVRVADGVAERDGDGVCCVGVALRIAVGERRDAVVDAVSDCEGEDVAVRVGSNGEFESDNVSV